MHDRLSDHRNVLYERRLTCTFVSEGQFNLWRSWLLAVCIIVIVFGLVMALLSWMPFFSVFNGLADDVFWPGSAPGAAIDQYRLWVHGMLGATMAG